MKTLKHPAAFLPIVMSLASLCLILGHVAMFGFVHETDEGTPAHLFQLLMVGQVPIVGFFALSWLPRAPREALLVLGLQCAAAMSAFGALFVMERMSA
jgi:hypothetical protein